MTRRILPIAAAALAIFSGAKADVFFDQPFATGSLAAGASISSGAFDIDFFLQNAQVGDPPLPTRIGNLVLGFNAYSDVALMSEEITLFSTGQLRGSGILYFNQTVVDISDPFNPVEIASFSAVLTSANTLPFSHLLTFSQPSTAIKVRKSFVLAAPDTPEDDYSGFGQLNGRFEQVPEPTSIAALLMGGALMARRLRKGVKR
ncbi:MAG: PEP-CTERM sorting domain-containing protein [Armatimonadetes bacterium]|nr:PEP-CTERM sorting domain-containing protein [Armatimonadota bacterium]